MKSSILQFMLLTVSMTSCYELYNADIDTDKRVLVVDALITNETASYRIRLTYASPFDSVGMGVSVPAADVFVGDDHGNTYLFRETEAGTGNYISDPAEFVGIPGNTYTLHIHIPDGEVYESDPQRLFPVTPPDSIYTEFDYQEIIERSTGLRVISHGANILADIKNQEDTLPRFRFIANMVTQYFYFTCPMVGDCIYYYCWQTESANPNINLTGVEYSADSASVNKHVLGFVNDNTRCFGMDYSYRYQGPGLPYLSIATGQYFFYTIHNRLVYVTQYILNSDAYSYYKSMDEQLRSEGKLFDPIAVQLTGNINCITNPGKKVFGFFETSSVSYRAYKIDFVHPDHGQPSLIEVPMVMPPEDNGCWVNRVPPFWVFL